MTVCSSSGRAHGAQVSGRKIVYCHTPARWLYQADRYYPASRPAAAALRLLGPRLRRWDAAAAAGADRYLANSHAVRERIADLYGIDAEVVHPPVDFAVEGEVRAVEGIEPGFVLCVSRLLSYKNIDAVTAAAAERPALSLVVVGTGPEAERLRALAPPNVTFLGSIDDPTLRWLYQSCAGLVAASFEDFGLTPVEAAGFGKPTAARPLGRLPRHHRRGHDRGVLRPAVGRSDRGRARPHGRHCVGPLRAGRPRPTLLARGVHLADGPGGGRRTGPALTAGDGPAPLRRRRGR